uniref:Uncharacterized protein n=1 Tax=Dunaliella tertiolecta TaxID=3047 RepID=A0A7S3QYU0_DUNTE
MQHAHLTQCQPLFPLRDCAAVAVAAVAGGASLAACALQDSILLAAPTHTLPLQNFICTKREAICATDVLATCAAHGRESVAQRRLWGHGHPLNHQRWSSKLETAPCSSVAARRKGMDMDIVNKYAG